MKCPTCGREHKKQFFTKCCNADIKIETNSSGTVDYCSKCGIELKDDEILECHGMNEVTSE